MYSLIAWSECICLAAIALSTTVSNLSSNCHEKIVNPPCHVLPSIQIGPLGYRYGLVGEDLSNNLDKKVL